MSFRMVTVLLLAEFVSFGASATLDAYQALELTPGVVAATLSSGTLAEREAALAAVRQSPGLRADSAVRAALRQELARIVDESRRFEALRAAAPEGAKPSRPPWWPPGEGAGEYDMSVEGLTVSLNDPIFVPELTWLVGGSGPIVQMLGALGDLAFPTVLARYSDTCSQSHDCPALMRGGLLDSIASMINQGTLRTENRSAARDIASNALDQIGDWEALSGGIAVAAALCDQGLTTRIINFVNGPNTLGNVSALQSRLLLREASGALTKCQ